MIVKGDYYSKKASALQERERDIAGIRGDIVDRLSLIHILSMALAATLVAVSAIWIGIVR